VLNKDVFASVILPVCRRCDDLSSYVDKVSSTLSSRYENFEIIVVDDGHDRTLKGLYQTRLSKIPGLRYLKLSRPVGLEIAINAGFESVIGDVCLTLVPETDPVENLLSMAALCEQSGRVVIGRFEKGTSSAYSVFRKLFYFMSRRWLDIPIVENATYCIAIHRTALNSVLQIREKFRFFRLFVGQIGLEYEIFSYKPLADPGISYGRGLRASFEFAVDVIVGNSLKPLRLASLFSFLVMSANFVYVLYILAIVLIRRHWVEGWVTLSLEIAMNSAVFAGGLAIGLEYLRTLILESKDRPLYFVTEDQQSPLLAEQAHRLNIVEESRSPRL
jgi:glycosyltransferase involved in cell wall biosynthesis